MSTNVQNRPLHCATVFVWILLSAHQSDLAPESHVSWTPVHIQYAYTVSSYHTLNIIKFEHLWRPGDTRSIPGVLCIFWVVRCWSQWPSFVQEGKTQRELALERRIGQLLVDLSRSQSFGETGRWKKGIEQHRHWCSRFVFLFLSLFKTKHENDLKRTES